MKVWLVKLEEPIPLADDVRPYRMSMLANALLERGHKVVRWCSDFDHLSMKARFGEYTEYEHSVNYQINFVDASVEYSKPVSIKRIINNFQVLRNFYVYASKAEKPDIIVCSMPTPTMASKCAKLSKEFNIPLVIDARDMWPDIIEYELKGLKYLLSIPLIYKMKKELVFATNQAIACVGITDFFVDFLLKYAGRNKTERDKPFSLGYKANELDNKKEALIFWNENGVELPNDEKIIYFAGRLNSTVFNAIGPVIDAAKKLQKLKANVKFVICGSGQFQGQIVDLTYGLKNIVLTGEVPPEYLGTLREYSYIAIQPIENREDYLNSLSNKFFEYISSGLPILTFLGGLTENTVIENTCGYRYETAEDLVILILKLLDDGTLYNKLSINAKNLFDGQFEAKQVYGAFSEHLECLCEKSMVTK